MNADPVEKKTPTPGRIYQLITSFTLFVKVEGVDPVNGKRPNRNINKKFLILGIAIIIGMKGRSEINLLQGRSEINKAEYIIQNETNVYVCGESKRIWNFSQEVSTVKLTQETEE